MNCNDFQDWLLTRDVLAGGRTPEVKDHLNDCKGCHTLYTVDEHLEGSIKQAFHQQEVPKGLSHQIELTLDHAKIPGRITRRHITGLVACIALIFVVVFMVFHNRPFRYKNLQQLSETAVVRHLAGNTSMSFTADEIEAALAMLSRELKFNVTLPDLKNQGYTLLGGRLCFLGDCKIAYLFYEKQNRISSVFIMDYDHLNFNMADGSSFSNDIKGCHTDIWKEKGQVYAMVY